MTCTCEWTTERGAPTMARRDDACEQHGDGSLWWRKVERRRTKMAAAVAKANAAAAAQA